MAKSIMVQGTMSNAGKSLLVAGLCRLFKKDGYTVAPFKSQNMALNSFITKEGLEMGRAQVVQAEAAGIEPSVLMNPILLKPTSDKASQIIVNGKVYDNMNAKEYYTRKREMVPHIKEAYDKLSSKYDIIVIEGAGSPAEINLQDNDIVNMYMAHLAKAPVLLAGDIDRGGVFASLVGTMMLFKEEDRKMVKGTIINKFRGDKAILEPGLDMLKDLIKVPTVGVIPYLNVDIDDEDSLTEKFDKSKTVAPITIAVIKLPRISNFTDFNALEYSKVAKIQYVDRVADLGNPDMIVIPGTKNTMSDLLWLRQSGLEASILKYAQKGKPVFGICGGFQMLGEELEDPYNVEHGGTLKGMGLLSAKTVFGKEKVTTRATGVFTQINDGFLDSLSNVEFEGYEIHMGNTVKNGDSNAKELTVITCLSGEPCNKLAGLYSKNIYGSYIHGIFDNQNVVKALFTKLLKAKGLDPDMAVGIDIKEYKESQYDILQEGIRNNMDVNMLYDILNSGI
ncbi:MAG: cobyric acid synthase [Eubacteriales bacterium]